MKDQYGRTMEYLRVSVTDRCNLRCVYCMPEEGVPSLRHEDILSYDEIERFCRICAGEGISRIKLTGGEPLVRRNLEHLVKRLKEIPGMKEVTLTTNGVLLAEQAEALYQAGLNGVNISLDTLDKDQYEKLTRRDELERALAGLEAALAMPGWRVKVNCTALGEENEDQYVPLAALAAARPLDVRFIEVMPVGAGGAYKGSTQKEILARLKQAFGEAEPVKERQGNGPAVYWQFSGFAGKIGCISAMSHPFCGACNRIRLTSEGFLKTCLQYSNGADMRALLRGGCSDGEIAGAVREAIFKKPKEHCFGKQAECENIETRRMSQIGG